MNVHRSNNFNNWRSGSCPIRRRTTSATGELPANHQALTHAKVKLLDFGLARSSEAESQLTSSGMILGTPSYMVPEQASDDEIDARANLFSLGVVLYRMTTGKLPFPGKKMMEILRSLATVTPESACIVNSSVPRELSDLIDRLLAKEAKSRPASALVVVRQLAEIEAHRMGTSARPAVASVQSDNEKQTRRSAHPPKMKWIAAGFLVASALLGIIVIKLKDKDGNTTTITVDAPKGTEVVSVEQKPDGATLPRTQSSNLQSRDESG